MERLTYRQIVKQAQLEAFGIDGANILNPGQNSILDSTSSLSSQREDPRLGALKAQQEQKRRQLEQLQRQLQQQWEQRQRQRQQQWRQQNRDPNADAILRKMQETAAQREQLKQQQQLQTPQKPVQQRPAPAQQQQQRPWYQDAVSSAIERLGLEFSPDMLERYKSLDAVTDPAQREKLLKIIEKDIAANAALGAKITKKNDRLETKGYERHMDLNKADDAYRLRRKYEGKQQRLDDKLRKKVRKVTGE